MKKVCLGNISDATKLAGFEFTKYIKYIDDGEIIAIRALNLKDGTLILDDVKYISREVSESLERSQLQKNDIVISYTGTIGECAQIAENGKYHLAPNVAKITPKTSIDPDYLFQYIRSSMFKNLMKSYSHGSTQPTIPMRTIRELPVYILPFDKQKKVGSLLKSIDRKIDENKKINKNLCPLRAVRERRKLRLRGACSPADVDFVVRIGRQPYSEWPTGHERSTAELAMAA